MDSSQARVITMLLTIFLSVLGTLALLAVIIVVWAEPLARWAECRLDAERSARLAQWRVQQMTTRAMQALLDEARRSRP